MKKKKGGAFMSITEFAGVVYGRKLWFWEKKLLEKIEEVCYLDSTCTIDKDGNMRIMEISLVRKPSEQK